MHLRLANGALGTVGATRFASGHLNDLRLRIYGTKGGLEVAWERNASSLRACLAPDLESATWATVDCPVLGTIYERFIAAIRGEGVADPDFARGAALQRMLDRAEQSAAQGCVSLTV
jgi:predicted dehydrogenase